MEFVCFFVYLESCIWSEAISRCFEVCADLTKSATESPAIIRKAFGEGSLNRARAFDWHARFRADRDRRDR
jgi:hypothetical protein